MHAIVVRILRLISTIAWVFFIVLFTFVALVIIYRIISGGYVQRDIPVYLKSIDKLPTFSPNSTITQFNQILGAEVKLKMNLKMTSWTAPIVLIGFLVSSLLILSIVFQVRKIFYSLNHGGPFIESNNRRLRIISACLAAIAIFNLMEGLFNRFLLDKYGGDAHLYYMGKVELGTVPIVMAMCVFILSGIFRQGHELKTENEAFV